MKKLIIVTNIIFATLFCVSAYAFEIMAQVGKTAYQLEAIKPANSFKVMVLQKGFYLALEKENFMLYGQDVGIDSLSIGYRYKALPWLFLYAQGGYYHADYNPSGFGKEGVYRAISKQYGYSAYSMPMSDHYELNYKDSFGAEVGVGVKYPISKRLSLDASIGYRYLRMWADYDGLDASGAQDWIMSRSEDFSAVKIYGGLSWEF